MTLHARTEQAIRHYWSTFLGCSSDHFDGAASVAVAHAGLGDYNGIWCFRRGRSLLVSVPPSLDPHRQSLLAAVAASSDDATAIGSIHGHDAIERVIGPAVLDYADTQTFRSAAGTARLLGADDAQAIARMRAACPPLDWEHGGGGDDDIQAGVFVSDQLVSLASYSIWGDTIAHISIVTDPHYRGQRFGHAAVGAVAAHALDRGLILQYRTLASNTGSLAIARSLGFVPWATTVAVRLRASS